MPHCNQLKYNIKFEHNIFQKVYRFPDLSIITLMVFRMFVILGCHFYLPGAAPAALELSACLN